MTGTDRGPSGRAAAPAEGLRGLRLPLAVHDAGRSFARIHRTTHAAVFFSPGPGRLPAGRFDSASGRFGVLYAGFSVEAAFVETVLRSPARRLVGRAEIADRSLSMLTLLRPVRLVQLHGAGLQQLGLDNAITTGPYAPCAEWADALHDHPERPDGLAYASRHDPDRLCLALFSRAQDAIVPSSGPAALSSMRHEVARLLRQYGKGLEP